MATAVQSEISGPQFTASSRSGWVGIDIGTTFLKVAQIERSGKKNRLVSGQILPVISRATPDGNDGEAEPEWPLASVEKLRPKKAVASLPRDRVQFRSMHLPVAHDCELRQLIANELIEAIDEEFVFDFWAVPSSTNNRNGTQEVFVATLSRDLSNQFGRTLLSSGLTCQAIDATPFAIARAIILMKGRVRNSCVLAVDLGESATSITLVASGQPVLYRELRNSGMRQITDALTAGLNLSASDCRTLLHNAGLQRTSTASSLSELRRAVHELTSKPLGKVVAELQKTFRFVKSSFNQTPPQEVVLFGSGAGITGMDTMLTEVLEVPARPWKMNGGEHLGVPQYLLGQAAGLSALPVIA